MKKRILASILIISVGIPSIFLYEVIPLKIPCLFEEITGYYCPGCGITRMIFALLHGDIKQAFAYNSLVMILLPLFLFIGVHHYYCWLKNKDDIWLKKIPNWFWYILIIIAILFGILRNIEFFSFLAPHQV